MSEILLLSSWNSASTRNTVEPNVPDTSLNQNSDWLIRSLLQTNKHYLLPEMMAPGLPSKGTFYMLKCVQLEFPLHSPPVNENNSLIRTHSRCPRMSRLQHIHCTLPLRCTVGACLECWPLFGRYHTIHDTQCAYTILKLEHNYTWSLRVFPLGSYTTQDSVCTIVDTQCT